jgi:hypothetical protein
VKTVYRWISSAALSLAAVAQVPHAWSAELTLPRDGWTSWQVATVDGAPDWCCWSGNGKPRNAPGATCRLDDDRNGYSSRDDDATTDVVRVYARSTGGKIDRLRTYSATCAVETVKSMQDLGTVAEDDSARWLADLAKRTDDGTAERKRIADDVFAALAINRGDVARDTLAGIARDHVRKESRKQAIFWLAMLRGREGAQLTASVMFNDEDPEVRQHGAFALTQSRQPGVVTDMIRLGNTDKVGKVRAQAWFWLAQMAAPEAEVAIAAALRKDTDDNVREQAIFALSQLPAERGTRALIAAVEDQSLSREQRKRALFWLGQSDSDAAQAYLTQLLTSKN